MANNMYAFNETSKFGKVRQTNWTKLTCQHQFDTMRIALQIERALEAGNDAVFVTFYYVDTQHEKFNEDDWATDVLDFYQFESLVNMLVHEFYCMKITDIKPLKAHPCYHEVEALFCREGGNV